MNTLKGRDMNSRILLRRPEEAVLFPTVHRAKLRATTATSACNKNGHQQSFETKARETTQGRTRHKSPPNHGQAQAGERPPPPDNGLSPPHMVFRAFVASFRQVRRVWLKNGNMTDCETQRENHVATTAPIRHTPRDTTGNVCWLLVGARQCVL